MLLADALRRLLRDVFREALVNWVGTGWIGLLLPANVMRLGVARLRATDIGVGLAGIAGAMIVRHACILRVLTGWGLLRHPYVPLPAHGVPWSGSG
jgi:predicted membrane protein